LDKDLLSNLRLAYDRSAERRSNYPRDSWKEKVRAAFVARLREEQKMNLLELGAGPGLDSLYFKEQGLQVITTDLSPESVRIARERGLDARVMDLTRIEFPAASFDAVYAMNCLLHVPEPLLSGVLVAIRQVLVPDGLFYYGQWGGKRSEGIWEEDINEPKRFFSLYPDAELQTIVSEHFTILSFEAIIVEGQDSHYQSFFLRNGPQE
jgi:SAM-dependent methyltransferase